MPSDLYIVVASRPENIPAGLESEDPNVRDRAIEVALTRMRKIWFGEADWSLSLHTLPTDDEASPSERLIALMGKGIHQLNDKFSGQIVALAGETDARGLPMETPVMLARFLGQHDGQFAVLVLQ